MAQSRSAVWTFCAISACLFIFGGCATTQARREPGPREVPAFDARTFYETTTIFGASFSEDESKLLMTSDATGIFNAYAQPLEGGEPVRLTHSTTNAIFGLSYFPHDDRILYTSDQGGNERNHVYVLGADAKLKDLTPGDNVKASFLGFSADKSAFWVTTNERDSNYFDLYRFTTDGYSRRPVFTNREGWIVADVSRNGRHVALIKTRSNADNDVYVWDADDPDAPPRHVTPHEGDVSHAVFTFSPDSRQLVYGTNEHSEFRQGWTFDLNTGQRKPVIKADWDVSFVYFSENGRFRVSGINQDGRTEVTVLDTTSGRKVRLPKGLPEGDLRGVTISPSETKMAFYINDDRSPSNLFVLDLESGDWRRLTETLNPAIRREHLVKGRVVRFRSFDGLKIPAILYRPHVASRTNRVPALVWVHGGPGGQSRHGYNAARQHLVNHGYAVLAVNNRGSSGYGKSFYHMDDRRHGQVDLKDCVWGRKYLESLDWIDAERIGIIGGSYGGYMVAAALAFEPDAFDVGINIFGVTNWLRTLKSIPPWWSAMRDGLYAELGDPDEEEERLRRISPLFHASNIKKPLLVVQGANDPRVLKIESDEIVEAVRKNGVPVEYVVFPDEGHGFRSRENRITASDAYVKFLNQFLR